MERQKYEKKLAEKRANREGGTEEASHVGETGNRTMQRERVERKKKKKKMNKNKNRKEREREREETIAVRTITHTITRNDRFSLFHRATSGPTAKIAPTNYFPV